MKFIIKFIVLAAAVIMAVDNVNAAQVARPMEIEAEMQAEKKRGSRI